MPRASRVEQNHHGETLSTSAKLGFVSYSWPRRGVRQSGFGRRLAKPKYHGRRTAWRRECKRHHLRVCDGTSRRQTADRHRGEPSGRRRNDRANTSKSPAHGSRAGLRRIHIRARLYSKLPLRALKRFCPRDFARTAATRDRVVAIRATRRSVIIAAASANPGALELFSAGSGRRRTSARTAARQCRLRAQAHSVQGPAEAVTMSRRSIDFSVQLTDDAPQIQQGTLVALAVSAHSAWRITQCADHDRTACRRIGLSILQRVYLPAKTPARYRRKASRRDRKSAPRTPCWTGSLRLASNHAVQPNSIRGVRSGRCRANIALVRPRRFPPIRCPTKAWGPQQSQFAEKQHLPIFVHCTYLRILSACDVKLAALSAADISTQFLHFA